MQVIKSRITGYCHGVDKTIRNALLVLKKAKRMGVNAYSIGNLIHNEDVVKGFEKQGLKVIEDSNAEPGVALVRAHGLADKKKQKFIDKKFVLVDSTCQNIQRTQSAIFNANKSGKTIIVVGIKNHDETDTLLGTCDCKKYLVSSAKELNKLFDEVPSDASVAVAVQTTFPEEEYCIIKERLGEKFCNLELLNKLCGACLVRKSDGLKLAQKCDAVFVVGGVNSSNTKELANWIKQSGKPVYFVENVLSFTLELDREVKQYKKVGVCSGTSTPAQIIDDVCKHLENL